MAGGGNQRIPHSGGITVPLGDGSVRSSSDPTARHRLFAILDRTNLPVSPVGADQALTGQIVTNPADRHALAELLHLIAEPATSALLLPAIQKAREASRRH